MFIGILAEDTDDATDSVTPFGRRGYMAGIGFYAHDPDLPWDALAMIAGGGSGGTPALIASYERRIMRRLITYRPQLYFRRINRTLRGRLRIKLEGVLRELPGRIALICPASPATGETVENGILYVGSVPLTQTEFAEGAADLGNFVTVRTAFEMAEDPEAAEIDLTMLRQGVASIEAELERCAADGVRAVCCDAMTADDLRILAQVVLNRPERYLPVGCAGFIRAIAESLPVKTPELPPWSTDFFTSGRILVVVGSLNPVSRRQALRLTEGTGVRLIKPTPENSLKMPPNEVITFRERFPDDKLLVLMSPDERVKQGYEFQMLFYWMTVQEKQKRILTPFDGYVIVGTGTAYYICSLLGVESILIYPESEPGMLYAILNREKSLASLPAILKAGSFGDDGLLARCVGLES